MWTAVAGTAFILLTTVGTSAPTVHTAKVVVDSGRAGRVAMHAVPTRVRAAAARPAALPLPGWSAVSLTTLPSVHANQGVAVLIGRNGRTEVVTRGLGDIPRALAREGWVHVGDPDGHGGYLVDAYQARAHAEAKMFLITTPDGHAAQLVHALVPGEMVNNSFAAVSPDGHWLVSGEWSIIRRLLVFALPALTPSLHSAPLPLATTITLTRPLRNVQGCSFDGAATLVCTTNDPRTDLFPVARQLVDVALSHPLDGRPTGGTPVLLGAVPQRSACPGSGEIEGIDVTDDVLRFAVVEPPPCRARTDMYTYARRRV